MASEETGGTGAVASPQGATRLDAPSVGPPVLVKYRLDGFYDELRKSALRSTFLQALEDVHPRTDSAPIKPRCRAGPLMELVIQRRQEDVPVPSAARAIHPFAAELLESVVNFQPGTKDERLELPAWIHEQQPWQDDRKVRRKRQKSKKKRKRKHRDDGEGRKRRRGSPGEADDDAVVAL
ncbi:hypothetical protein FVE85_2123 [Porphyridium purpureum]|uniref:Uncharacterized protein n=1 Tax=Porphyridium purpureum TaxID=35688 RepID=A0A5J4YXV9_PORPP|nr:hypothetical protein FVE85_2123 [Porphyridium purpureum]|eukprot:POR6582..scf209_3